MKRSVSFLWVVSSMCLLFAACGGGGNLVIKERFSQNPKVGVYYTPSSITKVPDYSQAKYSARVPADFESIAKNEIVSGLKAEWPNASVEYFTSAKDKMNYDLVVWVAVGGAYHLQSVAATNNPIILKMHTVLTIYDPHSSKNLTSLMGAWLGEVSSPSAKTNADSVFTELIPPVSLKAALEQQASRGLKDYFKEVKEAKK
jgi:hypothetical protein